MKIVPGYPNDAMVLVTGIGGAASGQRFIIVGKFFWLKDLVTILAHSFPDHASRLPCGEIPARSSGQRRHPIPMHERLSTNSTAIEVPVQLRRNPC
jgi:hypothetical protein